MKRTLVATVGSVAVLALVFAQIGRGAPGSARRLIIADNERDCVQRYDGATGAFTGTFVEKHSGGMNQPMALLFGPHDHDLYVSTGIFAGPGQRKAVLRYDGETGAFVEEFTKGIAMNSTRGITFGPDGHL